MGPSKDRLESRRVGGAADYHWRQNGLGKCFLTIYLVTHPSAKEQSSSKLHSLIQQKFIMHLLRRSLLKSLGDIAMDKPDIFHIMKFIYTH